MDHVVYVDKKAHELEKLITGKKSMIVRGSTGRKLPYGRVQAGDRLFFVENNGNGLVRASSVVSEVFNSEKLAETESADLLKKNQSKLDLTPEQFKRWSGKRYLVLVEVEKINVEKPFSIDRTGYGNMDDWLPVGDIETVKE